VACQKIIDLLMLKLFNKDVDKANPACALDDLSTIVSFKKITSTAKTFFQNNEPKKNLFSEVNTKTVNDSIANLINANEIGKNAISAHDPTLRQSSKPPPQSEAVVTETNKAKTRNRKKTNKSREDLLKQVCMKNTYLVYKCLDPYHKVISN
jgi:hypothetical protein